jgi:transcriptional regulator with XRE-family HTH domain
LTKRIPAVDLLVARRVAAIRSAALLCPAELAKRANLPEEVVLALERGERPTMEALSAISLALGVKITAFFEGEVEGPESAIKAIRN